MASVGDMANKLAEVSSEAIWFVVNQLVSDTFIEQFPNPKTDFDDKKAYDLFFSKMGSELRKTFKDPYLNRPSIDRVDYLSADLKNKIVLELNKDKNSKDYDPKSLDKIIDQTSEKVAITIAELKITPLIEEKLNAPKEYRNKFKARILKELSRCIANKKTVHKNNTKRIMGCFFFDDFQNDP